MKFDEFLFSHLGEMGRYQKVQFLLVTIPTMLCALHAFSWTFAAHNTPYRCALPTETDPRTANYWTTSKLIDENLEDCWNTKTKTKVNESDRGQPDVKCNYVMCSIGNDTCTGYVFDHSQMSLTAQEKWDIVCDRHYLKAVVQAGYYAGQMAGSIVFGILGDKIGRKKVFFIAIILQMIAGMMQSIVPVWWMYVIFRAATGFAHPGIFVIAVIIGMELVGPSYRKLAGVISGIFYALGQVILGGAAYYITDFQWLHVVISAPGVIFLTYWWLVPESARWLVSLQRWDEADKVLQKAAKMNGVTLPDKWWEQLDQDQGAKKDGTTKKYSTMDLIATPKMRRRTLAVFFLWPVAIFYVSFIMGALIEMPALVIVYLLIDRIGRRPVLAGGFAIPGIVLLANIFLPELNQWMSIAQLMIVKGSITAVYASIYTFTPEIFPTVVRNTAMGYCSTIARVGAISASFISMWIVEKFGKIAMLIPFSVLALSACLVTWFFLPETMSKHLPETIQEIEGTPVEQEMEPLSEPKNAE
ncbi:unnamed protein product, partial [Mesorhabditis belari]|uniref:Major facilitator superfamily (MFS) profile domain-containing protein n=1 Tax=Mesorhabditis belari TaxID=2138241 RepID=A0AAF3FM95_9BILA